MLEVNNVLCNMVHLWPTGVSLRKHPHPRGGCILSIPQPPSPSDTMSLILSFISLCISTERTLSHIVISKYKWKTRTGTFITNWRGSARPLEVPYRRFGERPVIFHVFSNLTWISYSTSNAMRSAKPNLFHTLWPCTFCALISAPITVGQQLTRANKHKTPTFL